MCGTHIHMPAMPISPTTLVLLFYEDCVQISYQSHQSFPVAAAVSEILWEMACHKLSSGLLVELHSANWRSCSLLSSCLVHRGRFIFRSSLGPLPFSVLCVIITPSAHKSSCRKKSVGAGLDDVINKRTIAVSCLGKIKEGYKGQGFSPAFGTKG